MVEVAISLAIIGIALVGIIGVLPLGMRTQQDNREETIVDQDATILMEDIRNGAKGADDLTNYIYAITNVWTEYDTTKIPFQFLGSGTNGYTYSSFYGVPSSTPPAPYTSHFINSGTNIIGLLTTPELQGPNGELNLPAGSDIYSNHVVAYVYSISGPAVEKPPQDVGGLMRQSSFGYRLIVQNVQVPMAPSTLITGSMQNNLFELRLFFRWPQLPSGGLGPGAQSFRTMVAGQLTPDFYQPSLYFFQSQSFTNYAVVAAESQAGSGQGQGGPP